MNVGLFNILSDFYSYSPYFADYIFFLSFLVGFNVKAQLGRRLLVLFAYKIIVVRQPHLVLVWLFFFFFKGKTLKHLS